jgi:signal transduction histidine kinase/phage shock protein PspC (stress-responsive transcriptional regulator)
MQETVDGSAVRPSPLYRSRHDRVLTGTAAGLAERIRVHPTAVRLGLVLLTLAGGVGLLLYGLCFVGSSGPGPEAVSLQAPRRPRTIATGSIVLGALLVLREAGVWFGDPIVVPTAVAGIGSSLLASRSSDGRHLASSRLAAAIGVARTVAGVGMIVVGTVWLVAAVGPFTISIGSVVLVLAVVAGLSLGVGPFILHVVRQATDERRERIRSEERAAVAAHLHDSVLQTLALIQRTDASPEVAGLARRQERELRSWLYGRRIGVSHGRLGEALEAVAARVEAHHPVGVDVVAVGDCRMDERLHAMVEASAEAVLNAARHSGDPSVSVFVEVGADRVDAYVRDRGRGFVLQQVGHDRHGISDSIRARVRRAGGGVTISTHPGEGTEVHLWIPRGPA